MTDLRECPVCRAAMTFDDGSPESTLPSPPNWFCDACGTIVPDAAWNRRAEPDHQLSMEPVKVSISPNALGKMDGE